MTMRLYLCEKPSQAKDIAAVLGASRRGDGCWLGHGVTVTWCIGHLLETAPPDAYDAKYKRWVLADLRSFRKMEDAGQAQDRQPITDCP